jgi:hypothetical protein
MTTAADSCVPNFPQLLRLDDGRFVVVDENAKPGLCPARVKKVGARGRPRVDVGVAGLDDSMRSANHARPEPVSL